MTVNSAERDSTALIEAVATYAARKHALRKEAIDHAANRRPLMASKARNAARAIHKAMICEQIDERPEGLPR